MVELTADEPRDVDTGVPEDPTPQHLWITCNKGCQFAGPGPESRDHERFGV